MMRRMILVSLVACLSVSVLISCAGIDPVKKVMDKVERKIDRKVDASIDKGLDEVEGAVKGGSDGSAAGSSTSHTKSAEQEGEGVGSSSSATSQQQLKAWSKYDFVPGDEIIFLDDQAGEENGEFPSRWDLHYGNVEIAVYGEEKVINFVTTRESNIVPLMAEKGDYLPEKFTLEFDAYFVRSGGTYRVRFWDMLNQKPPKNIPHVLIASWRTIVEGFGETTLKERSYPFWEHIAISFNTRSLKVYFGEQRVANIPNFRAEPMGLTISSGQVYPGRQVLIKNIRLAKGSKKLYDRIVADGKFVTRGILFDVNKATIRPESMGVINKIVAMMKAHEDLNLRIEGHTDSDGEKGFNQELSEKRAASVKHLLVELGIAPARLETMGHGESKPVAENSTPEGKANNRRVEFVKI